MNICLPPDVVDKFTQSLKSGKIDPQKLSNLTSEERHNFFKDLVGEGNAKFVNSEFESKLLLKNQQRGMITWAKNVAGLKPDVRRDLLTRISKLDKVLDPVEEKAFLKDLASTKLGFDVTSKEAKQIANMSSRLQELAAKQKPDGTFPSEADRMAYGRAKYDLGNYVSELKNSASKVSLRDLPKQSILHPLQTTSKVAGFTKSVKAAFDDSALFRQNWKTLLSHPGIWAKNALKNINDLKAQGIQNKDVMREVMADIHSRPNADNYRKMGIAVGKAEEEFGDPTLITKMPGIGRIYKTTEVAFNALMYRTRADLADHYLSMAEKAGLNTNDPKFLKSLGSFVNSQTGRANLGRFEGSFADAANNIFFSPRFIKSQVDTLLHVVTGAGSDFNKEGNFIRKEAAKNLMKIVGMTASIFAISNAISPGSVELDPRSSKFGKIKAGDTTFDLTGGFGSIATLAARLYTQQYKSNRGIISTLGSSPTAPTGQDIVDQFVNGKLSPFAQRAWVNLVTHQEFNGSKPTIASNISNLFEPLPVNTYMEAKGDPHAANSIVTEVADALGISANTSNPSQYVKQNPSASDQGLKNKIGATKYQQYNQQYNDRLTTFTEGDFYTSLPSDKKQSALTIAEKKIKENLYKQYGYKPPKSKSDKNFSKQVQGAVR